MVRLFYELGADISLKQVFLSSIPASLAGEAERLLQARGRRVIDCTVEEIQQEIHVALEDACMKKQAIKEVLKGDKSMEKACKRPELYIKCSSREKDCSYPTKKKKHYKKWKMSKAKSRRYIGKKWKYLRKKRRSGRKYKSSRCYICNRPSHFAKNCPRAPKQGVRLVQQLENATGISLEKDDVESLFSPDEEAGPSSIAALEVLTDSNSNFSGSDSDTCYMATGDTKMINLVNSIPHVPVSIFTSKYTKPIKVIAFLDTGAAQTIMNPEVLPKECWKPHIKLFSTASNKVFSTHLISRPLKIQFFLGCYLITRVLGSALPRTDIVIDWVIITKVNKLRMTPEGVRFKHYFQPHVQTPRLFMAQDDEVKQILSELVQELKHHSCADSHSEFLKKCPHPLWKNEQFFVKLPFKKNEDINPTKASHSGMNPEHQKLATVECAELLQQDLIEPFDAPWACETFYVNKRSEQVRGKLRLVINYQPLNHFLQDDKFLLPNKQALFSSLSKTKVFSKFDLKAGFWQLGIHLEDRPKTGFCIPNAHYQWKVMPFGLKTARSLFQKAMFRVFAPIMDQALVYIDDILLFSPSEETHIILLRRFSEIIQDYGIMLSEKKTIIGQREINFLGMQLANGQYQPEPHVARKLLKYPEESLTKKQIQ
ncbi:hypothetical protein CRG98_002901 [Punica granatum]|uniref:CCHC-type domain-containing protein n=1 Tax=Punica granatum TaxID=22663 RepID=A0A2I0L7B8_PUNGR|nr:hypothetical protein CRG98_002901 [Punica granatum]